MSGLGNRYWGEVIEVLRSIIPVYDRVNRVISLGRDEEFRRKGITGKVREGDLVLDAGSGYGNMSRVALGVSNHRARVFLYDPIPEMLAHVNVADMGNRPGLASGVFENMPFKDSSFDAVLCGYSLRDAIQLRLAISEMHRVLKSGGRLVIVDLGKPDGSFARALVSFYLKYLLGLLAFTIAGKAGLKFRTLYGTYLRWPRNSDLEAMLKEKFRSVDFAKPMFGGAVIISANK